MLSSGCSFLVMERQSFNRDQVVNAQSEDKVCEVNAWPIVADVIVMAYAFTGTLLLTSTNDDDKVARLSGQRWSPEASLRAQASDSARRKIVWMRVCLGASYRFSISLVRQTSKLLEPPRQLGTPLPVPAPQLAARSTHPRRHHPHHRHPQWSAGPGTLCRGGRAGAWSPGLRERSTSRSQQWCP